MLHSNRPLQQVPPEPEISHLKGIIHYIPSLASLGCSRTAMRRRRSDIAWTDRFDALASRF